MVIFNGQIQWSYSMVMFTAMVMVILNCMLSWLPSGDGQIRWSYQIVIDTMNVIVMKCSHDFLVMVILNGHDHDVYSKRNGEFISNDDKRRKEHLLKTRMHFVKGPPTM